MGNTGANFLGRSRQARAAQAGPGMCLHTSQGARKYLNRAERQRVIAVMMQRRSDADLFGLTLAWSGARVSEVLGLTGQAFDFEAGLVTLRTLKRRKLSLRQVPLPAELLTMLDQRYALRSDAAGKRLWPFCRTTAWRHIRRVMEEAGVAGQAACPKGFRHAFGVGAVMSGVPVILLQRWLGHARLTTTAIYVEISDEEASALAGRYWRWSEAA